jgi:hypothetical protein
LRLQKQIYTQTIQFRRVHSINNNTFCGCGANKEANERTRASKIKKTFVYLNVVATTIDRYGVLEKFLYIINLVHKLEREEKVRNEFVKNESEFEECQ